MLAGHAGRPRIMAKEGFFLDFQGERRRLAPFKGILRSSRLGAGAPHLANRQRRHTTHWHFRIHGGMGETAILARVGESLYRPFHWRRAWLSALTGYGQVLRCALEVVADRSQREIVPGQAAGTSPARKVGRRGAHDQTHGIVFKSTRDNRSEAPPCNLLQKDLSKTS